jgi:hypothetical protein
MENHNKSSEKRKKGHKLNPLLREEIKLKIKEYLIMYPLKPRKYILQQVSRNFGVTERNLFKYLKEVEKEIKNNLNDKYLQEIANETSLIIKVIEQKLWSIFEKNNNPNILNMIVKIRLEALKFLTPYTTSNEITNENIGAKELLFKLFKNEPQR